MVQDWLHAQIDLNKLNKKIFYNMQKSLKETLIYAHDHELITQNIWNQVKISTNHCTDSNKGSAEEFSKDADEDDIDDLKGA